MNDYALSLNQCWASKTDEETDHTYDSGEGHILLWDEFCPQFPWVGPLAYSTDSLPTHVSILTKSTLSIFVPVAPFFLEISVVMNISDN